MKKLLFTGTATLKKDFLLYMSKFVRDISEKTVLIITDNDHFTTDMKRYEITPDIEVYCLDKDEDLLDVATKFEYSDYEFLMYDLKSKTDELHFNKTFALTDQYKYHLQRDLEVPGSADMLIVIDVVSGSKISMRYISKKFDIKKEDIVLFPLESRDKAIIIDNGYNDSLRMNKFSRDFKASFVLLIEAIVDVAIEIDEKELKKRIKKIWRKPQ